MPDLAYPDDLADGTVRLRPWTPDDLACVEQAATDRRIPEITSVPARYSPGEGLAVVHRQRGLARRAVALMTEWGLGTFARIEAWVEPDNDASRQVLAANGFQCEGLLRSFLVIGSRRADMLVHSRIRD